MTSALRRLLIHGVSHYLKRDHSSNRIRELRPTRTVGNGHVPRTARRPFEPSDMAGGVFMRDSRKSIRRAERRSRVLFRPAATNRPSVTLRDGSTLIFIMKLPLSRRIQ